MGEEERGEVSRSLNDYALIKIKKEDGKAPVRVTVDDTNNFFNDEIQFIIDEINNANENNEKVIVCTHHSPLLFGTSHPKFNGSACNAAFSTDLPHLLKFPLLLWCFGHTVIFLFLIYFFFVIFIYFYLFVYFNSFNF